MKRKLYITMAVLLAVWLCGWTTLNAACCVMPVDATGGMRFPSEHCVYDHADDVWQIIDGLPPGTTIRIRGPLMEFVILQQGRGGALGGDVIVFNAVLPMQMSGTGGLAGFNHSVLIPVNGEMHTGPRNPANPVQTFDTDMFRLQGQALGDPDFDLLRITAGSGFGLPSPGHTTLTRLSATEYSVDSFFDITYRIDFVGAPGSGLGGRSGSTTGTIRMTTCPQQPSGDNCYEATGGHMDFADNPIPADFFDPGSDPFIGRIELRGNNPTAPDTIVRRLDPRLPFNPGDTVMVPFELVQLELRGLEPITVTYKDGRTPELWSLRIRESPSRPSLGQTSIRRTDADGGFMVDSFFDIFIEVSLDNGQGLILQLPVGPIQAMQEEPAGWQGTSPKPNPPCDGNGLYLVEPLALRSATGAMSLTLQPPLPVSQYFALDSRESWQAALPNQVAQVDSLGWQDYMSQWEKFLVEGRGYPPNAFMPPDLYVWPDTDNPCPDPVRPSRPGLVMAWGDPQSADNASQSSAWRYRYPDDPDLSGATITVTVLPPCWINVVSFGMRDINGNIRSWYWNVGAAAGPGMLQCGVPTTISINAGGFGVAAATPAAASFMNNPAFDITKVQDFIVDENGTWVGGPQPVPPPGQTVPRLWNYWYDIIVTPNQTIKPTDPLKWSQPPVEIGPHIFLGWDELSIRQRPPLMADDWLCDDRRPVTDVHWWGSFIGWDKPDLPLQRPIAFHLGIWTDVPKDPTNPDSFSHPGRLIWEHICKEYKWNFDGFDKDPRVRDTVNDVAGAALFRPLVRDSCFQFYCKLPQDAWFRQKPRPNLKGRVHWLSIAAIYGPNQDEPRYPWGWKTRPHFFNDDAVRIFQLQDGTWPPVRGAAWLAGKPVEYPVGLSWDLAFELTTNEPERDVPILDLDLNGIVNLGDFRFFADQWLTVWPVGDPDVVPGN
jgi:hypothetical protein